MVSVLYFQMCCSDSELSLCVCYNSKDGIWRFHYLLYAVSSQIIGVCAFDPLILASTGVCDSLINKHSVDNRGINITNLASNMHTASAFTG